MEHLEDLQRYKDLWEGLKESIPQDQQRMLRAALKLSPGPQRDEQLAIVKACDVFLQMLAKKEHEAHGRTSRRSSRQSVDPQRTNILGFDRANS
jgi:hypothetical protein